LDLETSFKGHKSEAEWVERQLNQGEGLLEAYQ